MRLLGNDTSANLVTASAGAQTFFISNPSFYNTNSGYFLKGQSVPHRFRFYLANLIDIVDTDGTVPVNTVSSVSMRVVGRDFDNQATVQALIQNNIKAGNTHYRYIISVQQQRNNLVAGTNQYSINLSSLIGLFSHVFVIVRAASQISTPLANDPNTYLSLSKFSIKNASGSIIPAGIEVDANFNIIYQNNFYWTVDGTDINSGLGSTPKNIYSIVFSEQPEAAHRKGLATGGYHLTGLGENLNLTFASALSSNYVVDIIGFKYVILNLGANGILKKIEA